MESIAFIAKYPFPVRKSQVVFAVLHAIIMPSNKTGSICNHLSASMFGA